MAKRQANPVRGLIELAAAVEGRLHEFDDIDLNRTGNRYPSDYSGGSYPSLYIGNHNNPALTKLPQSGQASINYHVRRRGVEYDSAGNPTYSTEIAVHGINAGDKKEESDGSDGSGGSDDDDNGTDLEAIIARYDFDDRARNAGGQFAPGNDVGVDDMVDAYVPETKRKKKGLTPLQQVSTSADIE